MASLRAPAVLTAKNTRHIAPCCRSLSSPCALTTLTTEPNDSPNDHHLGAHHLNVPARALLSAANDDGIRRHILIDGVRDDRGSHRELDGARVDDADDVAGSRGLQDAEERPVAAVLGVQLDDLILLTACRTKMEYYNIKIPKCARCIPLNF